MAGSYVMPDVFYYLLSLRYPGSEASGGNKVCYSYAYQVILPMLGPGQIVSFTTTPPLGVFAWIAFTAVGGSDAVPEAFRLQSSHFGIVGNDHIVTQTVRDLGREGLTVITANSPFTYTVTNLSPLGQRGEIVAKLLVVPSIHDMETIQDALRRMHTSQVSEELLRQIAYSLGRISGVELKPLPPLGGP